MTGAFLRFAVAALLVSFCASAQAASQQKNITVGGVARTYYVYQPKNLSTQKVPVVFVLHPLTKDAAWAESAMGWDQCADKNGLLIVYGQSSAANGIWNAGLSPAERAHGADDVGYLEAVMQAVESNYSVDTARVYMVGFSSGAIMTAKMASAVPQALTAVATVEGMTGFGNADALVPTAPISAVMFRGTADKIVPYTSDNPSTLFHYRVWPAVGTASDWAQADGCASAPATVSVTGSITGTDYIGGTGGTEIELMTVNGGRHEYRPEDTGLIWQFFTRQKKATTL